MVDSTFATPVLQQPLALGAAIVMHSATKFLGGHGDVLAGVLATNAEWASEIRKIRVITGANLHPLSAYLLHRGLATLKVRVETAQAGAAFLAEKLAAHPAVAAVHYPGLAGSALVGAQMKGPGSILAFELKGGFEAASVLMKEVALMTPAVSLGSVDSLIQHPAALTHRVVDPGAKAEHGISEGLIRVSVGLEDPADLWADLEAALVKAMALAACSVGA
jgi:methionine-gamma-lyase